MTLTSDNSVGNQHSHEDSLAQLQLQFDNPI
jgi:hypothetical protein